MSLCLGICHLSPTLKQSLGGHKFKDGGEVEMRHNGK